MDDHIHSHLPEVSSSSQLETSSSLHDLSELYPALVQVFVVIISGYVCGRTGMISEVEGQGINTFVSRFALPCMLFRAMALLNFSEVNWTLMTCVLISKSVIFLAVLLLTILMSSRPIKYGRAGIFAITATQSNDFALGYPIIEALYRTSHPELPQYLYLFAPVSLIILNPIGFCFLELEKSRSIRDQQLRRSSTPSFLRTAWNIVVGVVCNPVTFMTFIGIAANLAFKHEIPAVLDGVLSTFGVAFSASALFYLGLKMVGRVADFSGFRLVVPALLILAKLLFLPLITQAITSQLIPNDGLNSTREYANLGFLYGSIPAAPTVFVFATQYGQEIDTVGTVLVLSTFLSGPWMFISAQMLSIRVSDLHRVAVLLSATQFQVGMLGIACAVWMMIVFILNGKWRKMPHSFTTGLVFSQFLACLGMLFWQRAESSAAIWHYLEFVLFLSGLLGTRTWTAGLAVALWLLQTKQASLVSRRKWLLFCVCLTVPVVLTVIVVVFGSHSRLDINPTFHYGTLQIILSAVLLSFTFTISVTAMVLGHIAPRRLAKTRRQTSFVDEHELHDFTPKSPLLDTVAASNGPITAPDRGLLSGSPDENLMEIDLSSSSSCDTAPEQSLGASSSRLNERESLMPIIEDEEADFTVSSLSTRTGQDPMQYNRHVVLVLCLTTSMLIGLFVCFWRVFVTDSNSNGIFVELEFLDGVLMFGQSMFVLAIFGLDGKIPFYDQLKRIFSRLTGKQPKI